MHILAQVLIPVERVNVHKHGAAGIGHICHMEAAIHTTRQVLLGEIRSCNISMDLLFLLIQRQMYFIVQSVYQK